MIAIAIVANGSVVYANEDGLPVIRIDTEEGVPILNRKDWVNMAFSLTDPNNSKNNISRIGPRYDRIRGRGNSTWGWPKKPYRIKFRENISFFGLPAAENWVLLAEFRDPTFLITPTVFELGRNVFDYQPFTNSYQHVHVYLNGRYDGVYILTEHRLVADLFGIGAPGRVKINPDDGWFVELDVHYDEDPKFITTNYKLPIMIKAPDFGANSADPKYNFVKNDWNELCDSLFSINFPENGYRDLIDMNAFIDFLMIQEIVHAPEFSRPASIFSYKDMNGKISMGPLWDFDAAFGYLPTTSDHNMFNDTSFIWDPASGPSAWKASIEHNRHSFFQRFFDDPIFLIKYKERWNEKYDELVAVKYFIEELGEKIRISVAEDSKRWAFEDFSIGYGPGYDTDHARQVELMIGWWERRILWLNTELNKVAIVRVLNDGKTTPPPSQAVKTHNGIKLTAKTNTAIEVYNLSGKLISRQSYNAGNHNISFGHLPRGVYIVTAYFGKEKQILRMPVR